MIHEGKDIRPVPSFALARVVDDGVTEAGIVKIGEHATRLEIIESAPYWLTTAGVKIEVNYREGDEITLRPPRKIGQSSAGQPIVDSPMVWGSPRWPKDVRLVALADIVIVTRKAPE